MGVIKDLSVTKLRQEEAFGFHKLVSAETAKCTDAKFTELQTAYVEAFIAFDKALKTGGASIISSQLVEIDSKIGEAYSGMTAQVNASARHFNIEKAAAGKEAKLILQKYDKPNALPYVQQSGTIYNIIQDLEAFDASDTPSEGDDDGDEDILARSAQPRAVEGRLTLIGAREWVDRLKILNEQFIEAYTARNKARANIKVGETKATRMNIDNVYRAVVIRLNALAEVNGDTDYIDIINAINTFIDRQKAVFAARKTTNATARRKKEEEREKKIIE